MNQTENQSNYIHQAENNKKELLDYCQGILSPKTFGKRNHFKQEIEMRMNKIDNKKESIRGLEDEIKTLESEIQQLKKEEESVKISSKSENKFNQVMDNLQKRSNNDFLDENSLARIRKEIEHTCNVSEQEAREFSRDNDVGEPDVPRPELELLNLQSYKGPKFNTYACDLGTFTKKMIGDCGISVNGNVNGGIHEWEILYLPIDHEGWLMVGVQVGTPCCSSSNSYLERATYGINVNNVDYATSFGFKFMGGHQAKFPSKIGAHKNEVLKATINCKNHTFTLEGKEFKESLDLPESGEYYLHFNPGNASFKILSHTGFK